MHTKVIVHTIVRNQNRFLFLKRSNNERVFPTFWDIPGGLLNPAEDPIKGIGRELYEETGLRMDEHDFDIVYLNSEFDVEKDTRFIRLVFLMEYKGGDIVLNKNEHTEFKWIQFNETGRIKKVVPYVLKAIAQLKH